MLDLEWYKMSDQSITPTTLPERIAPLVHLVRGERVLLDADLAKLYGVETGTLNRSVKRNMDRFPIDFMFQLTSTEWHNLKCQIGIAIS